MAQDSLGLNRMCQFFCQNLLLMTKSFGKWNKIRGSPCSTFQKKGPNVAIFDLVKFEWRGLAWVRQYNTLKESFKTKAWKRRAVKNPRKVRARTCSTKSPSRPEALRFIDSAKSPSTKIDGSLANAVNSLKWPSFCRKVVVLALWSCASLHPCALFWSYTLFFSWCLDW